MLNAENSTSYSQQQLNNFTKTIGKLHT